MIWFLFQILDDFGIVLSLIGVPVLTWLFIYIFRNCTERERNQTLVMLLLMAFSVFFWALFEQAASSITLFTDRNVNIGEVLPAGMFQALNPFFIVVFAPIFAFVWAYLGNKNIEPNAGIKFAIAILLVGIGFLALVLGAKYADDSFSKLNLFGVDVFMPYIWGAAFHSWFIYGFKIITGANCRTNDGYLVLSSSLAGYVSGLIAGLMAVPNVGSFNQDSVAISLEIIVLILKVLPYCP